MLGATLTCTGRDCSSRTVVRHRRTRALVCVVTSERKIDPSTELATQCRVSTSRSIAERGAGVLTIIHSVEPGAVRGYVSPRVVPFIEPAAASTAKCTQQQQQQQQPQSDRRGSSGNRSSSSSGKRSGSNNHQRVGTSLTSRPDQLILPRKGGVFGSGGVTSFTQLAWPPTVWGWLSRYQANPPSDPCRGGCAVKSVATSPSQLIWQQQQRQRQQPLSENW